MASQVKQIRKRKQLRNQKLVNTQEVKGKREIQSTDAPILNPRQQRELMEYTLRFGIPNGDPNRKHFAFYKLNNNMQFCNVDDDELSFIVYSFKKMNKLLGKKTEYTITENFFKIDNGPDYVFFGEFNKIKDVLQIMLSQINTASILNSQYEKYNNN